jgi:hypothetical protein
MNAAVVERLPPSEGLPIGLVSTAADDDLISIIDATCAWEHRSSTPAAGLNRAGTSHARTGA